MSHEYYNIVIGGEGVRRRSNGINAEKITFFSNFERVSKGLLSTIVAELKPSEDDIGALPLFAIALWLLIHSDLGWSMLIVGGGTVAL